MRRCLWRCPWLWFVVAAACLALSSGPASGAEAPGSLETKGKTAALPSMKGVDLSGAWKVLWGTLGIGGLAIAAALVWRKHGSRTWRAAAGEGLQVLGRAALSPRHHVFVVRFGDRKVLVGVSGDRMASLAVVEEGSPSGPRLEAAMTERGGPDRGAVEREIGCSRRTVSEADLVPYRRQVDRLRDLLRGRPPMGSAGREE